MITLTNGFPQGPDGLIVPNGSIKFQLNVDATVIAAPYGFVAAAVPVVFQFNSLGQIQPNAPAVAAKIWSNEELQPQLSSSLLGTYYLVTFYDQNGALINSTPLWWQFPETAGSTVDISQMTPISQVGGNIIFYPTSFAGGTGTVTSVAFAGDGTILSSTPSTPVTTSGNIAATLKTQSANLFLAGPLTGPAVAPTFRAIDVSDLPAVTLAWSNLQPASGNLILANTTFNTTFNQTTPTVWTWANITAATGGANQSSPSIIIAGRAWNGAASATESWTIQDVVSAGSNPAANLTFTHTGPGAGHISFLDDVIVNLQVASSGTLVPGLTVNNSAATKAFSISRGDSIAFNQTGWYLGNAGFDGSAYIALSDDGTTTYISSPVGTLRCFPLSTGAGLEVKGGGSTHDATIQLTGFTSGSTSIAHKDTVNTHGLVLPQTNSTVGQVITSDGSNPQQLIWADAPTMTSANGATMKDGQSSEEITLSLASATTDSSGSLLPAGAIIQAVVARVTQTISGGSSPTTWEVGDTVPSLARFISTGHALTAGTTAIGLNHMQGSVATDALGPVQTAADKVRITLDQIPGQGKVRVTVFWRQFVAPTS